MRGGTLRVRWVVLLALVVGGPACGGSTAITTTEASGFTTTPMNSTTTGPATTTTPAEAAPISLVALGDSFVAWSDWPEMLAEDLAAVSDAAVILDDGLAAPGALAAFEPDLLRTDPTAREALAGADVLVLQPRPFPAPAAMTSFDEGTCGEGNSCLDAAVDEMRTYAGDYLDLAVGLVDGEAIVVVVLIGSWPVDAIYPDLRSADPAAHETLAGFIHDLMRVVETAAAERGMMVVDIGAVFNGSDYLGEMDPGYLVADGLHLSEDGSGVVADALLAAIDNG